MSQLTSAIAYRLSVYLEAVFAYVEWHAATRQEARGAAAKRAQAESAVGH